MICYSLLLCTVIGQFVCLTTPFLIFSSNFDEIIRNEDFLVRFRCTTIMHKMPYFLIFLALFSLNTRGQARIKADQTAFSNQQPNKLQRKQQTIMSLSSVKINDDCIREFEDFKLRGKYSYILYKLDMKTMQISIDKTAAPGAPYSQFLEELPKEEARFAVTHIRYVTEDGGQRTKLAFVVWIPRDTTTRTKMLHASTLAPLKQTLNGIAVTIEGHDMSDVQYEDVNSSRDAGKTKYNSGTGDDLTEPFIYKPTKKSKLFDPKKDRDKNI